MFWENLDSKMFRPFSSPNASVYAQTLWALYSKMVVNWYDESDLTPRDCREAIQKNLLQMNQTLDWGQEEGLISGAASAVIADEPDDASRIYRYLKETGWLREIEEVGYLRITYMPKMASRLLAAFDDITRVKRSNIGARCQNVYLALKQAIDDPRSNALQVEVAADHAREFCTQLSTMAASCRELAHRIMEETATAQVLARFFNDFIKGTLLEDYSRLKSKDHPYRFRAATLDLVQRTLVNDIMMDGLLKGLMLSNSSSKASIEEEARVRQQLRTDLQDIYKCFQRIDDIMQKIEHYRCSMTKRTREAMQYAMSTPLEISTNIDNLVKRLGQCKSELTVQSPLFRDQLVSEERAYRARKSAIPAEILPLSKSEMPHDAIAMNRLMDAYYLRRSENKDRLRNFIETNMADKDKVTTADMAITCLDDFIASLQLRDLLNDAVPPSSPFYGLLEDFEVRSIPNEMTENTYLIAPLLLVTRRRRALALGEEASC